MDDERTGGGQIDDELVEVALAHGHVQAEMLRSVLRGSGIESAVTGEGETWGVAYPVSVGPMSRVSILVRPQDEERARALIEDADPAGVDTDVDSPDAPWRNAEVEGEGEL